MKKALVVFSGGQDSTICLYWALKRFPDVTALSFDYNQKHRIELEAAKTIARMAGVEHRILKTDVFSAVSESSLLGQAPITASGSAKLPKTFVPGRNLIFLSLAAAVAYRENREVLVTGVCETDYSGYPDCRRNTMRALELSLNLGMEAQFQILTPLMDLNKAESVNLACECNALDALAYSHTCYNGQQPPCGVCDACLLRSRGFQEAGVPDPLLQRFSYE